MGIRKLKDINRSLLIKLAWKFLEGHDDWAKFMRAKFTVRNGDLCAYYKGSSVWSGLKWSMPMVKQHSRWIVGDGEDIELWRDDWCASVSIKELVNNRNIPWKQIKAKVCCIITNGRWTAPQDLLTVLARLSIDLRRIKICRGRRDQKIWEPNLYDKFSTQSVHETVRQKEAEESVQHLFWDCKVSDALWQWSINLIKIFCQSPDIKTMLKAVDNQSSYIMDMWIGSILREWIHNTQEDLNTVHVLRVPGQPRKETLIKSCFWDLPCMGQVKINTDGASKGNPGKGGVDYSSSLLAAFYPR
ncbi:hypothetical protein GIB67_018472 [Kingdonia uniflora]|uniref:Uncharacterized protein n=1 Tax=Kingdonia uniflora TaxID=39325 RepID=A0A7J7LW62_9MAGN|nr:hypothetical protein GIB67_018472 [Kingdonia uniflora]